MRLINVDKLNDDIETTIKDSGLCYHDEEIMDCIENAPTVDAVPVVRCKDCRCFMRNGGSKCTKYGVEMGQSDYCSDPERKDSTGNG